jgi:hypothetical protein
MLSLSDAAIRAAVGIVDGSSATFLKQYGERRTGTNAVRAMLMMNFVNTFVLMHILGDKHSRPVDVQKACDGAPDDASAAWRFVESTTRAIPGETSVPGAYTQLRFLRAIHRDVYDAYRSDRFGFVISVRDPYEWAASTLRSRGWPAAVEHDSWDERQAGELLRRTCSEFNAKYRAWLECGRTHHRRVVVPLESLRSRPAEVLEQCAETFRLVRRADPLITIDHEIKPTPWDWNRSRSHEDWLEFTPKRPPCQLTERLRDIVHDAVDWDVMDAYGYQREPVLTKP